MQYSDSILQRLVKFMQRLVKLMQRLVKLMQYLVKFLHEVCEVHAVFGNIFAEFLGKMVTFFCSLS
jgi:hypothetical protein